MILTCDTRKTLLPQSLHSTVWPEYLLVQKPWLISDYLVLCQLILGINLYPKNLETSTFQRCFKCQNKCRIFFPTLSFSCLNEIQASSGTFFAKVRFIFEEKKIEEILSFVTQ